MIGPKELKFSGFDGCHPGIVLRKFSEDGSKTLPMGLYFFLKFSGWVHNIIL